MNTPAEITGQDIRSLAEQLTRDAKSAGYHVNPDPEITPGLVRGLIVNERRYGYRSCPCRLASGDKEEDLDIICPCNYRDADLEEYGACYCGLYVNQDVLEGRKSLACIPERRPRKEKRESSKVQKDTAEGSPPGALSLPVWRCRVCGYLCARESPPGVCPICKAGKERFERFM